MTLQDYATILRRSWLLIVISTVVGLLIGLILSLLTTPLYQASAQMFVSVKSTSAVGEAYSGGLFVQQRVKSYIDVVDSPAVLEPVIAELGLDMPYTALAGKVSAQNPPNTVLLNVVVTDTNPDQAAKIANAVAASYATEIARLEGAEPTSTASPTPTPSTTTDTSATPVQATVIKPATEGSKVSPRTRVNVMVGALLGLLIGVGIAVLRNSLDTTVKTPEELDEASGAASLGVVSYDPDAASSPLVALRDTPRAEAFRTIRTNLQYVDVDNPPRTVVITSSLPGEGKSTTACNLAIAVAQAGARVLLLEADLRRPMVSGYLGVDGSRGLTDVLIGRLPLPHAIIHWQRGLLDYLPAGAIPPNPSELLGSRHMAALLKELAKRYDMIIIDAPPLLPITDAAILATAADGAILVARHGSTRREQVSESAEAIRQVNGRLLGTILNFAPLRKSRRYGYGYGYDYKSDGVAPSQTLPGPNGSGLRQIATPTVSRPPSADVKAPQLPPKR